MMELETERLRPDGVVEKLRIEDGQLVVTKTYDALPFKEQAARERAATEGKPYGTMVKLGTIPAADYGRMIADGSINDPKAVMRYFQERPLLASHERIIK